VHNTYFTLPVLFIMISSHFPMTYSHPYGWAVLGLIMLAGVLIRQFFVLRRRGRSLPILLVIAALMLAGVIVALAPQPGTANGARVGYADLRAVLDRRCVTCHSASPTREGFVQPPKGVILTDAAGVAQHAVKLAETVGNRYMPIGNLTHMSEQERALVAQWFAQGAVTQ
jgi:uncharacterized membrane protein